MTVVVVAAATSNSDDAGSRCGTNGFRVGITPDLQLSRQATRLPDAGRVLVLTNLPPQALQRIG